MVDIISGRSKQKTVRRTPNGLNQSELRRAVWSVGTNLHKQVGADWTLPSCPVGYHIHVTWSSSRF